MKYNCNKTLDFIHELDRMCKSNNEECVKCVFSYYCPDLGEIYLTTQKEINILQEWSDKHPEKTRKEAFYEIFPYANVIPNRICFNRLLGIFCPEINPEDRDCVKCWNKDYDNEFEKIREKVNKEREKGK